jgi:hypothetical protein
VKQVKAPALTIACADSDGTGWTRPYEAEGTDPDSFGNRGYALDPTFIPRFSLAAFNNEGYPDAYAYRMGVLALHCTWRRR